MSFLSVPNLIPWLISNVNNLSIRAWIVTDQFRCIRLHFNLTEEGGGIKETEEGKRGGGYQPKPNTYLDLNYSGYHKNLIQ